ncbi:hypothetical protein ONZ45_g4246 [Pleurotus djamor]|nr:hypothetical protein ONZ45_g4246 [Pleurotus djamor]
MFASTLTKLVTITALIVMTLGHPTPKPKGISFTAFAEPNCVLTSPDAGDTVVNLKEPGQCVDFAMVHSFQGTVIGALPDATGHDCRIHLFPDLRCQDIEFANIGPLTEVGQTTDCITPTTGDFFSVAMVC